jgi:hypothetical protein
VKSLAPVATVIKPAWQRLNVATGVVTASARCYCGLLLIHIERYMLSTQINVENDIKQNKNVHK